MEELIFLEQSRASYLELHFLEEFRKQLIFVRDVVSSTLERNRNDEMNSCYYFGRRWSCT